MDKELKETLESEKEYYEFIIKKLENDGYEEVIKDAKQKLFKINKKLNLS